MEVPEFPNPIWMCDFVFVADITEHLNLPYMPLQGQSITNQGILPVCLLFRMNLILWLSQLQKVNYTKFPDIPGNKSVNPDMHITFAKLPRLEFVGWFIFLSAH